MIIEILKRMKARGAGRAISAKRLAAITGTTVRDVVKAVERERRRHIICSKTTNGGGYYRPETFSDVERYITSQENRIIKHAYSLRLPRRIKKRLKKRSQAGLE